MNPSMRQNVRKWIKEYLSKEEFERLDSLEIRDTGFGYDIFGFEKESVMLAYAVADILYRYYFRVECFGTENVPTGGRTILTPNHSGIMPFDAAMVSVEMIKNAANPRPVRSIMDLTSNNLPFVGNMLRSVGQIVGTRDNFEQLMKDEQLVLVFPEGAKGSGKRFWERYKLKTFNVGHVEFSLKYKAPIVPVAVIGGEEQMPNLYNIKPLADLLGTSMVPLPLNLLLFGPLGLTIPFPTKYRIYFGEPLKFYEDYPEDILEDPQAIRSMADKVQSIVQEMIDKGLEERKGIFT